MRQHKTFINLPGSVQNSSLSVFNLENEVYCHGILLFNTGFYFLSHKTQFSFHCIIHCLKTFTFIQLLALLIKIVNILPSSRCCYFFIFPMVTLFFLVIKNVSANAKETIG